MAERTPLAVSVVLAEPAGQQVIELLVAAGTTAAEAIEQSCLLAARHDLTSVTWGIAIHGNAVEASYLLEAGDRVEILRPLAEDPRTRRRKLARRGRTVGKSSAGGRRG